MIVETWVFSMAANLRYAFQIFALYPEQRPWIIEEILSSLIQLPNPKQKSGQFKCV